MERRLCYLGHAPSPFILANLAHTSIREHAMRSFWGDQRLAPSSSRQSTAARQPAVGDHPAIDNHQALGAQRPTATQQPLNTWRPKPPRQYPTHSFLKHRRLLNWRMHRTPAEFKGVRPTLQVRSLHTSQRFPETILLIEPAFVIAGEKQRSAAWDDESQNGTPLRASPKAQCSPHMKLSSDFDIYQHKLREEHRDSDETSRRA